jgi:hypothetical protein
MVDQMASWHLYKWSCGASMVVATDQSFNGGLPYRNGGLQDTSNLALKLPVFVNRDSIRYHIV